MSHLHAHISGKEEGEGHLSQHTPYTYVSSSLSSLSKSDTTRLDFYTTQVNWAAYNNRRNFTFSVNMQE